MNMSKHDLAAANEQERRALRRIAYRAYRHRDAVLAYELCTAEEEETAWAEVEKTERALFAELGAFEQEYGRVSK